MMGGKPLTRWVPPESEPRIPTGRIYVEPETQPGFYVAYADEPAARPVPDPDPEPHAPEPAADEPAAPPAQRPAVGGRRSAGLPVPKATPPRPTARETELAARARRTRRRRIGFAVACVIVLVTKFVLHISLALLGCAAVYGVMLWAGPSSRARSRRRRH